MSNGTIEKRKGATGMVPTYTGPALYPRRFKIMRLGWSLVIFFRKSVWRIGFY